MDGDIIKSLCYRLYQSFLIAPLLIYFLTKNFRLSLYYAGLEFFVKTISYYIFEKIWRKVRLDEFFGKTR